MSCVIAIDAGTTGVRSFAVGDDGVPLVRSYREFPQHFPQPGWVEHDADDIWRATTETLTDVVRELREREVTIAAASPISARPSWSGIGGPGHPARVPSCGRTGARPNAATRCARPVTNR